MSTKEKAAAKKEKKTDSKVNKNPAVMDVKKNAKPKTEKKSVVMIKTAKMVTGESNLKKPDLISKTDEQEDDDAKKIEESFNIIKNLNEQVKKTQEVKSKLQKDVAELSRRFEKHENNALKKVNHEFFDMIKQDILNEFGPLIKKLDVGKAREEIFNEIVKVIDFELKKIKSDFSVVSRDIKSDVSSKMSDLEGKIVDAVSNSEIIKREIERLEKRDMSKIGENIEKKIHLAMEKYNDKLFHISTQYAREIEIMKTDFEAYKQKADDFLINAEKIKNKSSGDSGGISGVEFTAFESKLNKLENDTNAIKSLVEKYEDELFKKTKDEKADIEKHANEVIAIADKKLKELQNERKAHDEFLVNKVNEIIDNVNDFEFKLVNMEKRDSKNINISISEKFANLRDSIYEELEKNFANSMKKATIDLKTSLENFDKQKEEISNQISDFNKQFQSMSEEYKISISDEIKKLKEEEKKNDDMKNKVVAYLKDEYARDIKVIDDKLNEVSEFMNNSINAIEYEKIAERDYLAEKVNEVIDKFEELSKKNLNDVQDRGKLLENQINKVMSEIGDKFKEDFSKHLFSSNEFLTRIETQAKEKNREISEHLEEKFAHSRVQFDEEFKIHVNKFDEELKKKESEFLDKLLVIESEKSQMLSELNAFKEEVAKLTSDYTTKLTQEVDKIKREEQEFESNKDEFLIQIKNISDQKKIEIEEYFDELSLKLTSVLAEEKETFARHENTFREIFNEKINNLTSYTKEKLDFVEKKFLEKSYKKIETKADIEEKRLYKIVDEAEKKIQEYSSVSENNIEEGKRLLNNIDDTFKSKTEEFEKIINNFEDRNLEFEEKVNLTKEGFLNEVHKFNDLIDDKFKNYDEKILGMDKLVNDTLDEGVSAIDNKYKKFEEDIRKLQEDIGEKVESKLLSVDDLEKSLNDKFSEKLSSVDVLEKSLNDKFSEKLSSVDDLEKSLNDKFSEKLSSVDEFEKKLAEKVEQRLTSLEKQLNKRFLDYDNDFSNFKSVLIDEVEDLVKEINKVIENKVEITDKNLAKINFIGNEAVKKINQLNEVHHSVEDEIGVIRSEMQSVKSKLEIFTAPSITTMDDHVNYMKQYERQLVALIRDLNKRGLSVENIRNALINKGHPRFYVSIMLDNFDQIYNR